MRVGRHRIEAARLRHGLGRPVARGSDVDQGTVVAEDTDRLRAEQASRAIDDGLEHRRHVARRLADDAQHLADRRLVGERFAQFVPARRRLAQQRMAVANGGKCGRGPFGEAHQAVTVGGAEAAGHPLDVGVEVAERPACCKQWGDQAGALRRTFSARRAMAQHRRPRTSRFLQPWRDGGKQRPVVFAARQPRTRRNQPGRRLQHEQDATSARESLGFVEHRGTQRSDAARLAHASRAGWRALGPRMSDGGAASLRAATDERRLVALSAPHGCLDATAVVGVGRSEDAPAQSTGVPDHLANSQPRQEAPGGDKMRSGQRSAVTVIRHPTFRLEAQGLP